MVLDVTAADNGTQKIKDTVVNKTIQLFEDGFNSFFSNTELTIEGRTASDPNFTLLTINSILESDDKKDLTLLQMMVQKQIYQLWINRHVQQRF